MTDAPSRQTRYPLRAVMRRTGLNADVIRAWERRYAAVAPERSAGGQRLYSEQDVVRLSLLQRATADGHSIGEIAKLGVSELEALLHSPAGRAAPPPADGIDTLLSEALGATARLEALELERVLKRAVFALGVDRFVGEVAGRFLAEVGTRWHLGSISPAHEHVASDTVRRVLAWVAEAYEVMAGAPRIVIATPSGEMHELGAMTVAAAAVSEGWRVVYLGPNLPARDIASAAKQVDARLVALSVVYFVGEAAVREVLEIAHAVPEGVEVIIGGPAAREMQARVRDAGVVVLSDVDSLRRKLRAGLAGGGRRGSDPLGGGVR